MFMWEVTLILEKKIKRGQDSWAFMSDDVKVITNTCNILFPLGRENQFISQNLYFLGPYIISTYSFEITKKYSQMLGKLFR